MVAVLISGVRTEAQDIVRSSEAVVRSFSANARARAFKASGTARVQGKTQRGDTTRRHNGKMMQNEKTQFYSW